MTSPNSAEAVAKAIAIDAIALCDHHIESCGASAACQKCITSALTAFATQQVREAEQRVWMEAEKLVEAKTTHTSRANAWSCRMEWLRLEFHRRAQQEC